MNSGGFSTGLIGGRFNMETEGFIKRGEKERKSRMWVCRESPGKKMTIRILFYSLRETESQSVSPRAQPTSSLAHWVSVPVFMQALGPGFTLAPSSGCCVPVEGKQMPLSSCPSPCPRLGTESRQS